MHKYADRLIKCGYTPFEAYSTCVSFLKDFPLIDLEMFISCVEKRHRRS